MLVKDQHIKFINTPLTESLAKGFSAMSPIALNLNGVPAIDYIRTAIFLQLSGALEQKMKSILWDLASNNYDMRYHLLRDSQGEYSSMDDKNKVLLSLAQEIFRLDPGTNNANILVRATVKSSVQHELDHLMTSLNLHTVFQREYDELTDHFTKWESDQLCECNGKRKAFIFKKPDSIGNNFHKLYEIYESAYDFRNACAHNTKSYQQNLATFTEISNAKSNYNIFIKYHVLLLVDRIFIDLFAKYRSLLLDSHKI